MTRSSSFPEKNKDTVTKKGDPMTKYLLKVNNKTLQQNTIKQTTKRNNILRKC